MAVVEVGLAHPGPHRFHAIAQLAGNPVHRPVIGAQLSTQGAHHPHRSGLLLRAVPTRRRLPWRLFLRHDSILVSKVRSLQDFQGDSVPRRGFSWWLVGAWSLSMLSVLVLAATQADFENTAVELALLAPELFATLGLFPVAIVTTLFVRHMTADATAR